MTATQADSEDYQHWPDDESLLRAPPSVVPGYNSHNGLRSYYYEAPKAETVVSAASTKLSKASKATSQAASKVHSMAFSKAPSEAPSKAPSKAPTKASTKAPDNVPSKAAAEVMAPEATEATPKILPYPTPNPQFMHPQNLHPFPQYQAYPQQFMAYPPFQGYTYAQPQPMATVPYGVPAYFGGFVPSPQMMQPGIPPGFQQPIYQPANYVYQAPTPYTAPKPVAWKGRTKAEVDEDNMKIAKSEDVYAKRKVAPVGVQEDQMFWVVETDGSHTLRYDITAPMMP